MPHRSPRCLQNTAGFSLMGKDPEFSCLSCTDRGQTHIPARKGTGILFLLYSSLILRAWGVKSLPSKEYA